MDPEKYSLAAGDHRRIFQDEIEPDLFGLTRSCDEPIAVIFGGQPGAGKSPAVDAAVRELRPRGGAVQIIGDDLRAYHPRYASLMASDDKTAAFFTDRDAGRWVEASIAEARMRRVNVIIEGTMRDASKVAQTMGLLRDAGYVIDARVLAVSDRLSWQGVLQRYEAQREDRGAGRMTAPHSHRDAYEAMPRTIERVELERWADRVAVYRRGGVSLYTNELQGQQWARAPAARETVEAERRRPMSLDEQRAFAAAYDRLAAQLQRPERGAARHEVDGVLALRAQARAELDAAIFRSVPRAQALAEQPALRTAFEALDAHHRVLTASGVAGAALAEALERARAEISERVASAKLLHRDPERGRHPGPER